MTYVSLTPQLEQFVKNEVQSGRYSSPSEVIRDALRRFAEAKSHDVAALREELTHALAQADRGETRDAQEVFAALREKAQRRARGDAQQ